MSKRGIRALVGAGTLAVGMVLLAGGSTMGCAVDAGTSSAPSTLKDGLTILNADPAYGVSAAFKQNGRVVYLETRVGALKDPYYLKTFPNEPTHVMDARIVDQEGHTFGLVVGADGLIDPSWKADIRNTPRITTKAQGLQRNADFLLARTAAAAFAAQAGPELADHVYHLTNMTRTVPQEDPHLIAEAARAESIMPADREYTANGCTTNLQEGAVYDKAFAIIAQHSAVYGWNYNGCTGSWDEYVNTCNHGTCANDSSMSYSCTSFSNNWSVWSYNALLDFWSREENTTTNNSSNTGACWTGYGIDIADVTVYGSGDPNHVCNDDSALEIQEIRNAGYIQGNVTGGIASGDTCEFTSHWYGPLDSTMYAPSCP